jgi:hypothetical protein
MEFATYKQMYRDVLAGIQQAHIVAIVSKPTLIDFPTGLPAATREDLANFLQPLAAGIMEIASAATAQENTAKNRTLTVPIGDDPLVLSLVRLILSSVPDVKPLKDISFERLLFSQVLISTIAHLESFLAGSVMAACHAEPRLLCRNKTLTWKSIIEAGSWEDVIDLLVEEYTYEFGLKPLSGRLKCLGDDLGLSLSPLGTKDLPRLEEACEVRHIIVHNGGRVSRQFLIRTGRTDLDLGEPFEVTEKYSQQIGNAAERLCAAVFVDIAIKFFHASQEEVRSMWKWMKMPDKGEPER